jgi:hypothetical protein
MSFMTSDEVNIKAKYEDFLRNYHVDKDKVWNERSSKFRDFWENKIISNSKVDITDEEIDGIVQILDSNGKGNKKGSVSVGRAMAPQDAWRRLFREIKSNNKILTLIDSILKEKDEIKLIQLINELYKENKEKKRIT